MDPAAPQLRTAAGGLPATGADLYAAHPGAGQRESGGGARGLGAADAEEPGDDERAGAPGGRRHNRGHGNGPGASHREGVAGGERVGEVVFFFKQKTAYEITR